MQEHRVTAAGETMPLPEPFFVLATQNPIEQEGTYPLPEAQLDRFLFDIRVGYPSADEEVGILAPTTAVDNTVLSPVLDGAQTIGSSAWCARSLRPSRHFAMRPCIARHASRFARRDFR